MDNTVKNGDKANIIFYTILILLILGSVGSTYYRIVFKKDYQIIAEVSCDPVFESCFVYECDPEYDGECSEDPAENISYYKNISKKASNIYECEKTVEKIGCGEELGCVEGEKDCFYTHCDPAELSEDEMCSE